MATEVMKSSARSSALPSSLIPSPTQPLRRLPSPCPLPVAAAAARLSRIALRSIRRFPPAAAAVSSSSPDNQTAVVAPPPEAEQCSAEEVVRSFYRGINGRDLSSVEGLIADDCVYEDLIFPQPFVGRKAILDFFRKFIDAISADLQFVIDDISAEDSSAVGVTWHLEWKGKPFPFSKGCSFYRLQIIQGKQQITYGRDSVEPAIKPGEAALAAIRGVTWLLQQFPQLEERL
ncbi:uncharacterized protein LOC116205151 [Punica granatum]|uniref:SnoaL-like domain-containing protein n=2 Tax=Punica granatum TaxID=22663 RepID=A0A218W607_PUNGR|nr:uncharacterized protein LOC116205151 [Punica granatum]OWM67512.1 hypothetical protein CDL15_Pgr028375 [Punica granatum]PKI73909.1 hypothetical protein CRG98_005697 [Punica granatum]